MKKQALLIVVSLFISNVHHAQVLGQDKTGFSTLIQPSSSFNLDFANKVVTLDFYQKVNYSVQTKAEFIEYYSEDECEKIHANDSTGLVECLKENWRLAEKAHASGKNEYFLWGLDVKGSSENATAFIIQNEKVLTSAQFSLTLGHGWTRKVWIERKAPIYVSRFINENQANEKRKLVEEDINRQIDELVYSGVISGQAAKDIYLSGSESIVQLRDKANAAKRKLSENFRNNTKSDIEIKDTNFKNIKSLVEEGEKKADDYQKAMKADTSTRPILQDLINIQSKINTIIANNGYSSLNITENLEEVRDTSEWKKTKEKLFILIENNHLNLFNYTKRITGAEQQIIRDLIVNYQILNSQVQVIDEKNKASAISRQHNNNHLIYFKAGFLANSFIRDMGNAFITVKERFVDQTNRGYRLDAGYTGQYNSYNYFGLSAAMSYTDNTSVLTASTYKTQTIDATITPNLVTTSEFKALSGSYDRFLKYEFNADYVRLLPFNDAEKGNLLLSLNPYLRHSFYDRSETLKPNTSAGLGVYAFNTNNGSIAGGLFMQADDLFNVNRASAVNFTKQITIGVVFKAAIKSFKPVESK